MVFFFNDTATTEIYTLSLHDALPISMRVLFAADAEAGYCAMKAYHSVKDVGTRYVVTLYRIDDGELLAILDGDRKSTRLNSSHANISYAVFCLKKKHTFLTAPNRSIS